MAYKTFAAGYLVKDEKVLLVYHKKFNKWTPPGGHVEENETPAEAVVREWKEELDLDIEVVPAHESAFAGDANATPIPMPFHIDLERRLFAPLNYEVEYIYILSEWFNTPAYKDVLTYITSVGCHYYFGYLPLQKLGLPVPVINK